MTWDEPPGSRGPAPLSGPGLPWGCPHGPRASSVMVSSRIPRAWPPSSSQVHSQLLPVCRTQEGQCRSLLASGPLSSQYPPLLPGVPPSLRSCTPRTQGSRTHLRAATDTGRQLLGLTPAEGAERGSQGGGGCWVSRGREQGFHGTRRGWGSQREALGWHIVRTGIRPPKYPDCPETLLQTGSPLPTPPPLGPRDTRGFKNRPG